MNTPELTNDMIEFDLEHPKAMIDEKYHNLYTCANCAAILKSKQKYNKSQKGKERKKAQNRRYYYKKKLSNIIVNALQDQKEQEKIPVIQLDKKDFAENTI